MITRPFRCHDAVIPTQGVNTGQIGMLVELLSGCACVQFGPDGPFRRYPLTTLRPATRAAGLEGVGGLTIIMDEEPTRLSHED